MIKLIVPQLPKPHRSVRLPESEAHHATRVLRLKDGDRVLALDGQGRSCICTLRATPLVPGSPILLEHLESSVVANSNTVRPPVHLHLALLKSEAMEWIIEKSVELGVRSVQPILTQYSVPQLKGRSPEDFRIRWQKIADQALKQCGRTDRLSVELPLTFQSALQKPSTLLWCDEKTATPSSGELTSATSMNLGEACAQIWNAPSARREAPVSLWVGPEGGWSPEERQLFLARPHALRIHLGPLILRAETAALLAISVCTHSYYSLSD